MVKGRMDTTIDVAKHMQQVLGMEVSYQIIMHVLIGAGFHS
jgi:hypothetical protein